MTTTRSLLPLLDALLVAVRAEAIRAKGLHPGNELMGYVVQEEVGELFKAALEEPAANVVAEGVQAAAAILNLLILGDPALMAHRTKAGLDPIGEV